MSIIVAERVAKSFDPQDVFWDISCSIAHGDRIALVGRNGTGKTTLLRILAGFEPPSAGRVHRAKNLRIGYLPQGATLQGTHTLWQEMMEAFEALHRMEEELHRLEIAMADPARSEEAIEAYAAQSERFEQAGGYTYQDHAKHVLMGLGFAPEEHQTPIDHLSGGQKTRAYLARLLLESPDLLFLDEPTNHLDLQAIEWLENHLNSWEGTVVLVAHDRYFMDRVVRTVWELAFGQLEAYHGTYSHYVEQRIERHERHWKEFRAQQSFIAKEEEYIRRNMAGQRSRQAKGRLKRLERYKRDELLDRPRDEATFHLQLQSPLRSGDKVIWSQDLVVGYGDEIPLFTTPDLDLRRGECIALLGPNGSGKTTFLKTILGEIDPLSGYARLGASLRIGYFAQVRTDLDPQMSILDTILEVKNLPLEEARGFLGRFLFTGDDVFKLVGDLSGGEQSRVALAKLVLQRANFLLLDEPTNHLDIDSQEILERVLDQFTGTILLVTHDRYLVDRLATQLWVINTDTGHLEVFSGTWDEYSQMRRQQEEQPQARQARDKWSSEQRQARRQQQRERREREAREQEVTKLEKEIHSLEEQMRSLQNEIAAASQDQETMRIHELSMLYGELESQLEERLEQWSNLAA